MLRHPGMHVALLLLTGQFFFVEAQPGIEAGEEPAVGQALGVEAGMGGSWRGSLPRFFLVARYERAAIDYSGGALQPGYASRREYDDLAFGLRILIPVVEPVRIYFDALAGTTDAHAQLARPDLPMLDSERFRPLGQFALGLQFRLFTHFSVGVRAQYTVLDHSPDALAIAAGERLDPSRLSLSATLGVHF
ncbi:MAG TPA: hypothetical protein VKN99_21735 [Polyangia bacterium]|nr:hypothetical protein [Polyangia bacterium]